MYFKNKEHKHPIIVPNINEPKKYNGRIYVDFPKVIKQQPAKNNENKGKRDHVVYDSFIKGRQGKYTNYDEFMRSFK